MNAHNYNRRDFMKKMGAGAAAMTLPGCVNFSARQSAQPDKKRPNILFILVDDMGWTGLNCFGNKLVETPNIDSLANQGMRFTSAYAAPVCSPARASILSGKYPARLGITMALPGGGERQSRPWARLKTLMPKSRLAFEEYTLAEALKDQGYATAHIGKWHVTEHYYHCSTPKQKAIVHKYYGFDFTDPGEGISKDKSVKDQTGKAIRFIEQNKDNPFFVFLSYDTVHTECVAPGKIVEKYLAKGHTPLGPFPYEGINNATYLAMIEYLDIQVGRLLNKLDSLDLRRNTLVVFLSDNGGSARVTRNDPLRSDKGMCYEGGIRVPMIIRWPGNVGAGTVCDAAVHVVDIYPTFLDVCGGNKKTGQIFDGESLVQLFRQTGDLKRDALFWHLPHYLCHPGNSFRTTPHGAVLRGDFKLIESFGDYFEICPDANNNNKRYDLNVGKYVPQRKVELFNLKDDIGERHNLANKMPEKPRSY